MRTVLAICPAEIGRVLQHADRYVFIFALRVPERDRAFWQERFFVNQSWAQPRSAQFVLSLPAGLLHSGDRDELVGGGEEAGTEDLLNDAARRGLGNRSLASTRLAVCIYTVALVFP